MEADRLNVQGWIGLAAVQLRRGDLVKAEQHLREAVNVGERSPALLLILAAFLQRHQRFGESQEILAEAPFDRILIDAPCSNTGVMRRRVDVRWRLKPADFTRMQGRQIEMVEAVVPLLKPKGALVYSTCSLEREENEDVVQYLARKMSILQLEEERRVLPFRDNFDGAFATRFSRTD